VPELAPHVGITLTGEEVGEVVVLGHGQVLEQRPQGEVGRPDPVRESCGVEPVGFPPEGRSHPLDRPQDLVGVRARERRLPGRLFVTHDAEKVTSAAGATEPVASGVRVKDQ
jgi:hypothetical protein